MPKVRLELKQETFDKLMSAAAANRRPVDWQAEVLLERALGIRRAESAADNGTVGRAELNGAERRHEAARVAV